LPAVDDLLPTRDQVFEDRVVLLAHFPPPDFLAVFEIFPAKLLAAAALLFAHFPPPDFLAVFEILPAKLLAAAALLVRYRARSPLGRRRTAWALRRKPALALISDSDRGCPQLLVMTATFMAGATVKKRV
jgi:hypothetical protein